MNVDSFFTIGSTHKVCQDYVISLNETHGINEGPFIALSDGCSSSPDTDFGSRILVKAIQSLYCTQGIYPGDKSITELIWQKAVNSMNSINGLTLYCLDATLLFAYKEDKNINVVMIGDGTVSAKTKDGTMDTKTIEYKGNAPLYLSYLHSNPKRMEQRSKEFDCTKIITETSYKKGNEVTWMESKSTNNIERFSFPIEDYEYISLFTDGVSSFVKQEVSGGTKTQQTIPEYIVVEEATGFKNNGGEFVRRRCQRFFSDWNAIGSKALDDFTMATIYTGS